MYTRPAVIAQIYLIGAVVAVAASFAPLWVPAPDRAGSDVGTYSLWTVVPVDGGGAALVGIVLILALVSVAVLGAAYPRSGRAVPVSLVVMAVIAVALLLAKPGAGDVRFGPGAGLLFGVSLLLALTAVVEILHSLAPSEPTSRE